MVKDLDFTSLDKMNGLSFWDFLLFRDDVPLQKKAMVIKIGLK